MKHIFKNLYKENKSRTKWQTQVYLSIYPSTNLRVYF